MEFAEASDEDLAKAEKPPQRNERGFFEKIRNVFSSRDAEEDGGER